MSWLLRFDRFTLIFIIASVALSMTGDFVFRGTTNYYAHRDHVYSLYYSIFLILVFSLFISFRFTKYAIDRRGCFVEKGKKTSKEEFAATGVIAYFIILYFIFTLGIEVFILREMITWKGYFGSEYYDIIRFETVTTWKGAVKLFYVTSFFSGLTVLFLLLYKVFAFRKILASIAIVNFILLFLYGSKFLMLLPLLGAIITLSIYKQIKMTLPGIALLLLLTLASATLATLYTNYRAASVLFQDKNILVDFFATVMPEQRDGAYLMTAFGSHFVDKYYYEDHLIAFFIALIPRKLSSHFFDLDAYSSRHHIIKHILGYTFLGGSARAGLIGESYFRAGIGGLLFSLGLYITLLNVCFFAIYTGNSHPVHKYFRIMTGLSVLWTFNSNFLYTLPFTFTIVFCYVSLLLFLNLHFRVFGKAT